MVQLVGGAASKPAWSRARVKGGAAAARPYVRLVGGGTKAKWAVGRRRWLDHLLRLVGREAQGKRAGQAAAAAGPGAPLEVAAGGGPQGAAEVAASSGPQAAAAGASAPVSHGAAQVAAVGGPRDAAGQAAASCAQVAGSVVLASLAGGRPTGAAAPAHPSRLAPPDLASEASGLVSHASGLPPPSTAVGASGASSRPPADTRPPHPPSLPALELPRPPKKRSRSSLPPSNFFPPSLSRLSLPCPLNKRSRSL